MKISKPIIIVGTGRCGSTVFQRLLSTHSQMMWLSGFCDRYPDKPAWNRMAVVAMGNPLFRAFLGEPGPPGRVYFFWNKHAHGFAEPCRDLVRTDVTARVKRQVHAALEPMLTAEAEPASHQDHRVAPDRVSERDLRGREVHPHHPRRPGGG